MKNSHHRRVTDWGRTLIGTLAGIWCVATFACDSDCGRNQTTLDTTDSAITTSNAPADATPVSQTPPKPLTVDPAESACTGQTDSFRPSVADVAAPNVKRMLGIAREVGTPRERINRTWWTGMPVERCGDLVELPDSVTRCSVRRAARGRALILRAETRPPATADAGANASSDGETDEPDAHATTRRADLLFVVGGKEAPVQLPVVGGAQSISVAPGLKYAVYDTVPPTELTRSESSDAPNRPDARDAAPKNYPDTPAESHTIRVDLRTGESCRLAECIRPVVSPESRWVVCRTPEGGIGRISLGGGPLETFKSASDLAAEAKTDAFAFSESDTGPSRRFVPQPVSFPSVDVLMVPAPDGSAHTFSW